MAMMDDTMMDESLLDGEFENLPEWEPDQMDTKETVETAYMDDMDFTEDEIVVFLRAIDRKITKIYQRGRLTELDSVSLEYLEDEYNYWEMRLNECRKTAEETTDGK